MDNASDMVPSIDKALRDVMNNSLSELEAALNCDGLNILQNNGEAGGQTVFHFHLHMIPRYKNDDSGFGWKVGTLTDEDKEDILSKMA